MTQKPILFSAEMVKAILSGRKTQTRRLVKPQPPCYNKDEDIIVEYDGCMGYPALVASWESDLDVQNVKFPYGVTGDVLWVRERFTCLPSDMVNEKTGKHFAYFADCTNEGLEIAKEYGFKWKPSIHMPREACRIFPKITNVRVERLQDISEQDAIDEGIERIPSLHWWKNYLEKPLPGTSNPFFSFKTLWQSINGEQSWNYNPWVWVIEFESI